MTIHKYEITILTRKENSTKVRKNLHKKYGKHFLSMEPIGYKRLAYSIHGEEYADYTLIKTGWMKEQEMFEINTILNLDSEVLRYLTTSIMSQPDYQQLNDTPF